MREIALVVSSCIKFITFVKFEVDRVKMVGFAWQDRQYLTRFAKGPNGEWVDVVKARSLER